MRIAYERFSVFSNDYDKLFGENCAIDRDYSTTALLRALALRSLSSTVLSPEQTEELRYTGVKIMRVTSAREIEHALNNDYRQTITVVECVCGLNDNIPHDELWKEEFTLNNKPFPVNQYLSQFGRTKIFLNPTKKRLVAYVDKKVTDTWAQAFNSVLCRLLVWYFPQELSPEDQKFFKSISVDKKSIPIEEKENLLVEYVENITKSVSIREILLHKFLDNVADTLRKTKLNALEEERSKLDYEIERKLERLGELYSDLDKCMAELKIFKLAPQEDSNELFTFFYKHKQLSVWKIEDGDLYFSVTDTLDFYDEAEFERIFLNPNAYLFGYGDRTRAALRAIFLERKGIIRTHAAFKLKGFRLVVPLSRTLTVENTMPNPHVYFYACSGGHEQYYTQYAKSGEWDLAIEQAIAATKNLNWGDTTVCEKMLDWLLDYKNIPCIYVNPDLTPIEKTTEDMRLISFNEFSDCIEKKQDALPGLEISSNERS